MEKMPSTRVERPVSPESDLEREEQGLLHNIKDASLRIDNALQEKEPDISPKDLLGIQGRYRKIAERILGTGAVAGMAIGLATFGAPHISDIPPVSVLWTLQGMEGLDQALEYYKNASYHAQEAVSAVSGLANFAVVSGLGLVGSTLAKTYGYLRS